MPISTDTNTPVVVKQKPAKAVWLKAEVVHADRHTLIVRELDNGMAIHTFTFSDRAKDKMEEVQDEGGYQTGDRVKVLWIPGSGEALRVGAGLPNRFDSPFCAVDFQNKPSHNHSVTIRKRGFRG